MRLGDGVLRSRILAPGVRNHKNVRNHWLRSKDAALFVYTLFLYQLHNRTCHNADPVLKFQGIHDFQRSIVE